MYFLAEVSRKISKENAAIRELRPYDKFRAESSLRAELRSDCSVDLNAVHVCIQRHKLDVRECSQRSKKTTPLAFLFMKYMRQFHKVSTYCA